MRRSLEKLLHNYRFKIKFGKVDDTNAAGILGILLLLVGAVFFSR